MGLQQTSGVCCNHRKAVSFLQLISAAASGPKRRRLGATRPPLLPERPPGPSTLKGFLDVPHDVAKALVADPGQRQRMELHLRKVIVTDTVFSGMACFEDALRIYLFASADALKLPRPQILHHGGCDCDPTAFAVLHHRVPTAAHQKLFESAEGRLPQQARSRLMRLLPRRGTSDKEAGQQYDNFLGL